jgi:hypothetical protein
MKGECSHNPSRRFYLHFTPVGLKNNAAAGGAGVTFVHWTGQETKNCRFCVTAAADAAI